MYESPIKIDYAEPIYESVIGQFDEAVMKAVQRVNISVDRDELVRALQYDRDQYEKGFRDGVASAKRQGEWKHDREWLTCSVCGNTICEMDDYGEWFPTNFCPCCGAKMEKERNDGADGANQDQGRA